jgi:cellulose synthase/poly-beta-1,6-N-acetylglucosamine synthase-like glycosyltransferase
MEFFLLITTLFYVLVFLYLSYMLYLPETALDNKKEINHKLKVSIIIPIRNEEKNILNLVKNLKSISYPFLEVIIVNDNSDDNSISLLEKYVNDNFSIIELPNNLYGKKAAIKYGLHNCSGDWIVLTDADTNFSDSWFNCIIKYFEKNDIILAPVLIDVNKLSMLNIFEYIEMLAMQGVSYASTKAGFPFIASGANMAIKKDIAIELYEKIDMSIISGDDVFILHEYLKSGKNKVVFVSDKDAIVYTRPNNNLKSFLKQRIRWISKVKYYKQPTALFFSFFIYFGHFIPFILLILAICCLVISKKLLLIIFLLKFLLDFLFMVSLKNKLNFPIKYIFYFPFVWIIYFVYISILPIISIFVNVNWKDRRFR